MQPAGERWPPVYDADDLVREIKRLTDRPDLAEAFFDWRRDRSMAAPDDVCQGDVVELASEVPVILEDGQPGIVEHPDGAWLIIGNTCDFARDLEDVRWTQAVPILDVGAMNELEPAVANALRRYTHSRRFHVPAWSSRVAGRAHVADLLRPVAVDKRALQGSARIGVVHARMARAAWILLNACLVRFLARDDGRYA